MRVNDRGNQFIVDLSFFPSKTLSNHNAFFHTFMGQHRTSHHISTGVNRRNGSGALLIHLNESALVEFDAQGKIKKPFCIRFSSDSNDQLVKSRLLLSITVGILNSDRFLGFPPTELTAGNPGAQFDLEALLGENLGGFFGNLTIHCRQKALHRFKHDYVSAEASPHTAQLKTNNPRANHPESLWHFLKLQSSGAVHDRVLVDWCWRYLYWDRSGSNNDVLGSQLQRLTFGIADCNCLR